MAVRAGVVSLRDGRALRRPALVQDHRLALALDEPGVLQPPLGRQVRELRLVQRGLLLAHRPGEPNDVLPGGLAEGSELLLRRTDLATGDVAAAEHLQRRLGDGL